MPNVEARNNPDRRRKLRRPVVALLLLALLQPVAPSGCRTASKSVKSSEPVGALAVEAAPPTDIITESSEGRCEPGYPYCLSVEGYNEFDLALGDVEACERHLGKCQADLAAVPREVEVQVERVVEERTPWWNWALIGGLVALIPVGVGVGWYLGTR